MTTLSQLKHSRNFLSWTIDWTCDRTTKEHSDQKKFSGNWLCNSSLPRIMHCHGRWELRSYLDQFLHAFPNKRLEARNEQSRKRACSTEIMTLPLGNAILGCGHCNLPGQINEIHHIRASIIGHGQELCLQRGIHVTRLYSRQKTQIWSFKRKACLWPVKWWKWPTQLSLTLDILWSEPPRQAWAPSSPMIT